MFLPVLFASALFLQQAPPAAQTAAQTATQTAAPATAPAPAETGQVVGLPPVNVAATPAQPTQTCRTEAVTGSRFGRRVCRSTVQTAEEAAQSREMLRRMQGARMPDGG
ncbi:hypothetical protein BrevBR_06695 [Brevundimonas sp. BR2-1]|uniref:hypothetical protein n=1 Tax=Brevundimonas sp. BR2-1 TaxID=3031123 RepID=UPI0030B4CE55